MPELPEVTVIVNSLNKKIKGLILESIEYDWPKKFFWAAGPRGPLARRGNLYILKDLKGAKVTEVDRQGKVILISTDKKITIVIHLKLTGQLIYQDAKTRIAGGHPLPPLNLPVPNKTTRVTFGFIGGGPTSSSTTLKELRGSRRLRGASHLYFNDMRKFGWVKVVESTTEAVREAIGSELGPDPLVMSYEQFRERLRKKPQSRIKKLLMDQAFVVGIGNIYSDEALWRAKIHPARPVVSLSDNEVKALFSGIRDSLNLAIEKGGSSANTFLDSGGERGLYLTFAKAYHMTGKPCARCKTPIERKKMDGRSAHFCPHCQHL